MNLPNCNSPTSKAPVLVAMSGGVDSSVAAALLVEKGHAVTGATMRLWAGSAGMSQEAPAYGDEEAVEAARRVCHALGIPHDVLDLRQAFETCVVEEFVREYARGRTPNPCLLCNQEIKFGLFLQHARALGMHLATGHYARIARGEEAGRVRYHLLRGLDRGKDQAYVLYMLDQEALAQTIFPLGGMTKAEVRAEAVRRGLPTAGRPESQEICFIPDNDYRRFLLHRLPKPPRPGPIRDLEGRTLGTHRGLPYYTVGQRKGLGLAQQPRGDAQSAAGRPAPLFVIAIDAAEQALVVGPEEALLRAELEAEEVTFISGQWPAAPLRVEAKIRYRSPLSPATLTPLGHCRIHLEFDVPQRAITPGQAVVFYEREEVLGGGIIC